MEDASKGGKLPRKITGRSPAYPFIPVNKALDRVNELYAQEGAHAAPLKSALSAWGYSPKSSGGRQTLATMRYYGLIDVTGDGDERMIKVSELGRKIILDKREDKSEKRSLIRQVALMPSAHKALFQQYPSGLPSDGTVHHYLVFQKQFNVEAATELIAEFKQTASQIGLYEPHNSVDKTHQKTDDYLQQTERSGVKIGDRIQWTSNGVDQFTDGGLILGFSEDGNWVFTDQGESGVPVDEVKVMEQAEVMRTPPAMPAHLLSALAAKAKDEQPVGTRKAVFPLDDGDVALIFPEGISASGLLELGAYLDIFLKKEVKKKTET